MITKIISGGQTGADQGGLMAARMLGIETGGFAPLRYMTEDGPAPWLKEYGLVECPFPDYDYRTRENVVVADATIIFGLRSVGSNLTERICAEVKKPYIWVANFNPIEIDFWGWLDEHRPSLVNVAGNRESKWPGIRDMVMEFLVENL